MNTRRDITIKTRILDGAHIIDSRGRRPFRANLVREQLYEVEDGTPRYRVDLCGPRIISSGRDHATQGGIESYYPSTYGTLRTLGGDDIPPAIALLLVGRPHLSQLLTLK